MLCCQGCAPSSGPDDRPNEVGVTDMESILVTRRHDMVREQIESTPYPGQRRAIEDARVLHAMRAVERHRFVPESLEDDAYLDRPLPIGYGQTISQPYIVAAMTELLEVEPGRRVLEIGTGSGYQAAVLAEVGAEVFTIEIVPELGERAAAALAQQGYGRVHCRVGDGYGGWPEEAPFERIILTASPPRIPEPLIDQLKPGGRLVSPIGEHDQDLIVLTKDEDGRVAQRIIFGVRFVPMTGEAQDH